MLTSILTGAVMRWALRRVLELGGLLTVIASIDPVTLQRILATIGALMTGDWDQVSLGALLGLLGTIGGLIWNAHSTFKPQISAGNQQVSIKHLPTLTQAQVLDLVERETGKRPTIVPKPR